MAARSPPAGPPRACALGPAGRELLVCRVVSCRAVLPGSAPGSPFESRVARPVPGLHPPGQLRPPVSQPSGVVARRPARPDPSRSLGMRGDPPPHAPPQSGRLPVLGSRTFLRDAAPQPDRPATRPVGPCLAGAGRVLARRRRGARRELRPVREGRPDPLSGLSWRPPPGGRGERRWRGRAPRGSRRWPPPQGSSQLRVRGGRS